MSSRDHNSTTAGLSRRSAIVTGVAALAATAWPLAGRADDYPSRPIKVICPYPVGGSTNILVRIVAHALGEQLPATTVVENKSGGANIGMDVLARSAPDGYTLGVGDVSTHCINPFLYARMPYDARADFTPLGLVGQTPTLLLVHPDIPARNVGELIAHAKSRPGKMSFASSGNGTSTHIAGELLKLRGGVEIVHVPYKSASQALIDLMAGRVDMMFYHPAASIPFIKDGRVRSIGVSSARRTATAPDVVPINEQGIGPFDLAPWWVLYGPAKLPAPITQRLRTALSTVQARPEFTKLLATSGFDSQPLPPAELDAFLTAESAKWGELVKRSGARID